MVASTATDMTGSIYHERQVSFDNVIVYFFIDYIVIYLCCIKNIIQQKAQNVNRNNEINVSFFKLICICIYFTYVLISMRLQIKL